MDCVPGQVLAVRATCRSEPADWINGTNCSVTYLRLGDGELALLISWQEGNIPQGVSDSGSLRPIFHAQGVTGLRLPGLPPHASCL